MQLIISNQTFESTEINSLRITEREVFIDCTDDFYRIKYKSKEEIKDAFLYQKLQNLTYQDLYDALRTLMCVCDVYINSKNPCLNCPLHKSYGCTLQTMPLSWI